MSVTYEHCLEVSLVNFKGQNPLEKAWLYCKVLSGKYESTVKSSWGSMNLLQSRTGELWIDSIPKSTWGRKLLFRSLPILSCQPPNSSKHTVPSTVPWKATRVISMHRDLPSCIQAVYYTVCLLFIQNLLKQFYMSYLTFLKTQIFSEVYNI